VKRKLVFGMVLLTFLLLLLAFVLLLAEYHKKSSSLRLKNGTLVELEAITYGTNHVVWHGTLFQKLLRWVPEDRLSKRFLNGLTQGTINTPTNSIVVWLHVSGPSKRLLAGITDTNGFGAFQSGLESLGKSPLRSLHPIVLKEWPRAAPQIAITLFEELGRAARPVGRLAFKNPQKQSRPSFPADAMPAKQKNGDLDVTLLSLEVLPRTETFETWAGYRWACRARFQVAEGKIPNRDWVIHSMWLADSGGNQRRATGPRSWRGESIFGQLDGSIYPSFDVFEIFSDPLWLDNPVWKVEADLIRAANFPPEETVTFSDVPMPSLEIENAIIQTNLFGLEVTLRSMKRAKAGHDMGGPGFAIEVNASGDEWVPKIVGIWDEEGKALRVPAPGYGPGYSVMRFPAGISNPQSLKVTVTLQQRRKFTFFVRPTVIMNVSN
jgi:hypothetical protein